MIISTTAEKQTHWQTYNTVEANSDFENAATGIWDEPDCVPPEIDTSPDEIASITDTGSLLTEIL